MKKFYALFWILVLAISAYAYDFSALDVNENLIYYNQLGGDSVEVTYEAENALSYAGDIIIPSSVNDESTIYRVVRIGKKAFQNCNNVTSVSIANGVTSINESAFNGCSGITSFTMPNSIVRIEKNAFCGCWRMETIPLSSNLQILRDYAFQACTNLLSITIPGSVDSIGSSVFFNCPNLQSIIVETGNTVYDSRNNCNAIIETATNTLMEGCLQTIIPKGVATIAPSAFAYRQNLTFIDIPNSVIRIDYKAFMGCSKLDTVICRASIPPTLDTDAFADISPTAFLHVPYHSLEAYQLLEGYVNAFYTIVGFSEIDEVTESSAMLKWIPDAAVNEYIINVYTSGNLIRQYIVDGNGNRKNMPNAIACVPQMKMDTTFSSTDYFVLSVDDLESGTDYNYTIDGSDAQGVAIYHEQGSFTTKNGEGIDVAVPTQNQPRKILRVGQIYILKGGDLYTLQGIKIED